MDEIQPVKTVRMRLEEERRKMETLVNIILYGSITISFISMLIKFIFFKNG